MNLPGDQSQWWDFDPSETPVPLTVDGQAVVEAAEQEVASAYEALAREETQPISLPVTTPLRRDSLGLSIALLLLGCLVMFVVGFRQGSGSARTGSEDGSRPSRAASVVEVTFVQPSELSTNGVATDQEAPSQHKEEM